MKKGNISDIVIRNMKFDDLNKVAELHCDVFKDYFLGHMGTSFVKLFYKQFINSQGNYAIIAEHEGKIVGSLIGSINGAQLYKDFYKRNFLALALIVMRKYLTDSYIRENITQRKVHLYNAVRALLFASKNKGLNDSTVNNTNDLASLLSIGLDSDYRGYGIADLLTSNFCQSLNKDGIHKVGLSVLKENERAIAFYQKNGWAHERSTDTALYFSRPTGPLNLEQNKKAGSAQKYAINS